MNREDFFSVRNYSVPTKLDFGLVILSEKSTLFSFKNEGLFISSRPSHKFVLASYRVGDTEYDHL